MGYFVELVVAENETKVSKQHLHFWHHQKITSSSIIAELAPFSGNHLITALDALHSEAGSTIGYASHQ